MAIQLDFFVSPKLGDQAQSWVTSPLSLLCLSGERGGRSTNFGLGHPTLGCPKIQFNCHPGFISLPMRRVQDDVGLGSVEEASISDHPCPHDGCGGGRSTLSEELLRWVHIGEKLDLLSQIDITWP